MPSRCPLVAVALLALVVALPATFQRAAADHPTVSVDQLRTGWDPAEPNLTPTAVTTGGFGELFHVSVDGVVFASPVTAHAVIVVATEHDQVYGIDENTGGALWQVSAGQFGDDHGCDQVSPSTDVGITSTPVIDPATNTVYLMARDFHGRSNTAWRLHALDLFTGQERSGWPVTIAGLAHNAARVFDPYQHESRPGLLLLGGTVFAGFGSFCDADPYQGWIASVSTTTRAESLYVDVPSAAEGAFWASGSGFVADGPNTLLATSANPPRTGAGQAPVGDGHTVNGSTNLADAVIRFQVGGDGITVTPTNYFSPFATDTSDSDLGSSGLSSLPDSMGVAGHPHLAVVGGKFGTLYVLDRNNLGGRLAGDAGAVSRLTGTDDLFGHVASWPGDGGFVYDNGTAHLNAFRVSAAGALTRVAGAALSYGSSSPLVTSNGTQSGSATVWIYDRSSHELRAYDAVPAGAVLAEIFHQVVGATGDTHFNEVSADQGRVLVAADDGLLHVFGVPGLPPIPCGCVRPPTGPRAIAVVRYPSGLFSVVAHGADGHVESASQLANGTWTPFVNLGGAPVSPVAAAVNPGGTASGFYVGADNQLHSATQMPNGVWTPWVNLGGALIGSPVAFAYPNGLFTAFARDLGSASVDSASQNPDGTWTPWVNLGGAPASDVAAVISRGGTVSAFYIGSEGHLHSASQMSNGVWTPWIDLQGALQGVPVAFAYPNGLFTAFARGAGGSVNSATQHPDGTWTPWVDLGGSPNSDPAALIGDSGTGSAFYIAANGHLASASQLPTGVWTPWVDLGGNLTQRPTAVSYQNGLFSAFGINEFSNSANSASQFPNGTWTPWIDLGGAF